MSRSLRELRPSGDSALARLRSENAATSTETPVGERLLHEVRAVEQDSAGRRRSASADRRACAASSRKRLTIAFWRLVIRSIGSYYSRYSILCYTWPIVKERILKKFEDEIHQLDRELKTELPQEIKRARELGDLRENAEYQAAKERQRLVEARISLLQKRVSEISLMNLDRIPQDKVGFGSTVTCATRAGRPSSISSSCPKTPTSTRG